MDKDAEHTLRTAHLSAIGKILSIFTHELRNALAAAGESAGLMADILEIEEKSGKCDLSKHMDTVRAIDSQIGRAVTLSQHLSRFSGRLEEPAADFKVHEAIEELIALIQRSIKQKRMTLTRDFNTKLPVVRNNPALFQLAVFCYLEKILSEFDQNCTIRIKTELSGSSILVRLIPEGNRIAPVECPILFSDELMTEVMENLGGKSEAAKSCDEILIQLPCSRA